MAGESRKKAYFISDLHLGATYDGSSRRRERMAVDFLRSIKYDASELYLLGDILDYWFEYRTVVPRGYVRFFGALADLADSGVEVTWFIGNHDIWIFDYLPSEIGMRVVDGVEITEIDGRRFFLSHGDGLGKLPAGFRFIRGLFRNRFCQFLFSSIHPRWTVPFAHRWSASSRGVSAGPAKSKGEAEPYVAFARAYLKTHPHIDYFIFGHRHILMDMEIAQNSKLVVLGDWIYHFSYAVWDGNELILRNFKG